MKTLPVNHLSIVIAFHRCYILYGVSAGIRMYVLRTSVFKADPDGM